MEPEHPQSPPRTTLTPNPTRDNSNTSLPSHEEDAFQAAYRRELVRQDIELRAYYVLNPHFLNGSLVTENMRARIRSFLVSQAAKQWIMRDSLALACTYVDLYFDRQGFCAVEDFQILAISCLILAVKIQEGKFPTIAFSVFNKQDLLNWQKKVVKRLSYQLCPSTYACFAEHVAMKWTYFTLRPTPFNTQIILAPDDGFNPILRRFYEQLDCALMVLKSMDWPLESLVINLFYLHVRMLNLPRVEGPQLLSHQEFLGIFYPDDDFKLMFQDFLRFYSENKMLELDHELGEFLKSFLRIEPSCKVFKNKMYTKEMRVWDKLSTFPKESYSLSKSIMDKQNPGTKKK